MMKLLHIIVIFIIIIIIIIIIFTLLSLKMWDEILSRYNKLKL